MLLHHLRTSYKKPRQKVFRERNSNKYYTQGDTHMLHETNNSFRCIVSRCTWKRVIKGVADKSPLICVRDIVHAMSLLVVNLP